MKMFNHCVLFGLVIGLWGCGGDGGSQQDNPQQSKSNEAQVQFNYGIRSKYLQAQEITARSDDSHTGSIARSASRSLSQAPQSFSPTSRSITQWPDYQAPSLSSTIEGPFDFSEGINLWFNIIYTNEVRATTSYLIKLNEDIGETPTAITSEEIFFAIAQMIGNNLTLTQNPLTITGPNESGGKIEITPAIEQGMILSQIGFGLDNRVSSGGISGTFESPQLISTAAGPFDLSDDNSLWFKIVFTDESDETISYQIKLDNTVGETPSQTTQSEIYDKILATVGNNLIINPTPLTIKAPLDANGTLTLTADIEYGMTLSQLGFAEDNRLSTGDGNGTGEQYTGTLTVYNQALNEYQYFPWSIYIEAQGFTVLSNSTLTLSPGNYTLSLLVSNLTRQYGGEGVIEVGEDSQVNMELQLAPVVGAVDASVSDLSTYSQVQVHFSLEQLETIDVPRLGILVNGESEYMFDISKVDSINQFYLDTLDTVDNFYLKFYDDIQLIAKSDSFNADLLFSADASASVELYPLVSEIDFSFVNDDQYPSEITLTIPGNIIDELGGIDSLIATVTIVGSETPYQQTMLENLTAVNDGYQGTTSIEISSFETIEFELEFKDSTSQNVLGGCSSSWNVSSFSQTLICASKVVGDNVVYTSLKSVVSINTVSILGNPVEGVVIKDQYDVSWGITGNDGQSQGYLSYRVMPGDYVLTGTVEGEVVITQSISLAALEAKSVTLVINDASTLAYPSTSCRQLIIDNPELPSGFYTIDVDGPTEPDTEANASQQVVYCNMDELNGGWTLVGYHANNQPWKMVTTVSPDASHALGAGLLADPFWNLVKGAASDGMMFVDDAGNVSLISASTLNNATCVNPLSDINSLINVESDTHAIFLTNDSACDLTYETRSSVVLKSNSDEGINLLKGTDDVFELWPYGESQSKSFHDGMWIYIK